MIDLKTILLKLKTEASERRDAAAEKCNKPADCYSEQGRQFYMTLFREGFDSRQSEIDTLISIVERQAEAINLCWKVLGSGRAPFNLEQLEAEKLARADLTYCDAEVLALLSGIEEKK